MLGDVLLSWWFLTGLVLCYVLAALVDNRMESCFSEFWHACRLRLRALLDHTGPSQRESREDTSQG